MQLWLKEQGIQAIREIEPVVLISPTSSINRKNLDAGINVVKSDNFGEWWRKTSEAMGVGTALGMLGRHLVKGMSQEDFTAIGHRISAAHVPPTYDWRAMLRLPHPDATPKTKAETQTQIVQEPHVRVLATPHGDIKISQLPGGDFALRNDNNEALIEVVKKACKGRGRWNPRYRNWIIAEAKLPEVMSDLPGIQV